MTFTLILLGVVVVALMAILAYVAVRSQLSAGPSLSSKTVVINTKKPDDQTLKGILHAQYADRWVLRDAVTVTALGPKPVETPVPGVVHVPVASISWVQEIQG